MKQYQSLVFETYRYDSGSARIELSYSLDGEVPLQEVIRLPVDRPPVVPPDDPDLDRALHTLFMIGGISYYKTCCPRKIEIRNRELTEEQASFWNTVYENGLGEFFYRNQIDFRGLVQFPGRRWAFGVRKGTSGEGGSFPEVPFRTPNAQRRTPNAQRLLVPVGGGKDSVVTTELLKAAGITPTLFRMGSHPLIDRVVAVSGLPLLSVERTLSPTLFELNRQGALNGHIPVTAYLSSLTVVLSLLYGFDAVVMSNEGSASEGNVHYLGMEINHQWSKSLEFERAFQAYLKQWVTDRVEYVSLLRPFSELQIMKLFSGHPRYFPCTTSCNANWRILAKPDGARGEKPWCGHCPKCGFCFALLAAFVPRATVLEMFGRSLFAEDSLLPLYRQLLGVEGFKPFECVGTPEETRAAFLLARNRGEWQEEPAMRMFTGEVLPRIDGPDRLIEAALTPSQEHPMPDWLARVVK